MHFAFRTSLKEQTRRLLLLQNAAFLAHFRGDPGRLKSVQIEELGPAGAERPALEEVFLEISRDRMKAASQALAWLKGNPATETFMDGVRRLVFLKGTNSHDYKFSSAALEDYGHAESPFHALCVAEPLHPMGPLMHAATLNVEMVDNERYDRQVVFWALLDTAETRAKTWLKEHPGAQIISRDRGGDYAKGAALGAPDAVQVTDRWHLLHNLTDALRRAVDRRPSLLEEVAMEVAAAVATTPAAASAAGPVP